MKNKSPILYAKSYRADKVIEDFLQSFYCQQLNYLASDLLNKGFKADEILEALNKAMNICRTAKRPVKKHFMPLYVDRDGVTIRDCKLSLLGYRLLLLNANPKHPATAHFQIKVLEQFNEANQRKR